MFKSALDPLVAAGLGWATGAGFSALFFMVALWLVRGKELLHVSDKKDDIGVADDCDASVVAEKVTGGEDVALLSGYSDDDGGASILDDAQCQRMSRFSLNPDANEAHVSRETVIPANSSTWLELSIWLKSRTNWSHFLSQFIPNILTCAVTSFQYGLLNLLASKFGQVPLSTMNIMVGSFLPQITVMCLLDALTFFLLTSYIL